VKRRKKALLGSFGRCKEIEKFSIDSENQIKLTPETVKNLLKTKVNPTEIKFGINTFKLLKKGTVLIETHSKEIETQEKEISTKCEGELKANIQKR
jgi:hypothetical protein